MTASQDGTVRSGRGEGGQPPFLSRLQSISSALDWSGRIVAVACLAFMFAALFVNVVLRYAFGSGIAWAYEIHSLLLPWLVGGGIVVAAARSRNIAVSLLPDMVGPRVRRLVLLAIQLVVLAIALSVLWTSQPILRAAKFQRLSTLGISQIWGYASLVYAFAAMAIIAAVDAVSALAEAEPSETDGPRVPSSMS